MESTESIQQNAGGSNGNSSSNDLSSRWSLRGKNFVVTGGSKGIGKAVVESLVQHEAAGVLFCSRSESLDVTTSGSASANGAFYNTEGSDCNNSDPNHNHNRNRNNTKMIHVTCDVSTKQGRKILVQKATEAFGAQNLHGLVNNVGTNVRKPILEQTEDEYSSMFATNVDAAYFLCREMFPLLVSPAEGGATIVNVSSAAGVRSSGTGAAYGMTKAALNHLTKILACEWASKKIRVNAVAPWMTMTPMLEEAVKKDPSQLDKVHAWTPMGRLATAQEVADPVVFLCLPASGYITGQVLGIDGGLTAQGFDGPTCE